MTEQLGEPNHMKPEARFARLEKEIGAQEYQRGLLAIGMAESGNVFHSEDEAREAAGRFGALLHEQMGVMPLMSHIIMRVSGENVKLASPIIERDESGTVTIKANESLLGGYYSRLYQFASIYAELEKIDGTSDFTSKIYIRGIDLSAAGNIQAGCNSSLPIKVGVEPTLLIPCEPGVKISSLLVEQAENRTAAFEELRLYGAEDLEIISDLGVIEQELYEADPRRRFELQSIETLRQLGRKGIEFSALSNKHADALNTAIAEVFTKDRTLLVNGVAYVADSGNHLVRLDVRLLQARLIDVVTNIPMIDDETGPALAVTATTPENERLCYVPLSQIDALYV